MEDKVILVDRNDRPMGEMMKLEAHQKGLLHRAVSVIILNAKAQMLLQQRALTKYHSAGLWTNTACTHPFPGESNKEAAIRRLSQEMGLMTDDLTELFHFTYRATLDNALTEHEFDHVFVGISDALPKLNPLEVMDFKFVDLPDLMQWMERTPEDFTVWFLNIMQKFPEYFNKITVL
ncbi:MAG: isopentenyl-diphosphate Delta-isomerase [Microbacter sp.]